MDGPVFKNDKILKKNFLFWVIVSLSNVMDCLQSLPLLFIVLFDLGCSIM